MRIGELSQRTGVPVPTIKYYLREGLLPPGEITSPNQARYGDQHVRRLQLIRALLDPGGLSIATIQSLLTEIEQPEPDLHQLLGRALKGTTGERESVDDEARSAAEREIDEVIRRHGWRVHRQAPARRAVAEVIVALRRLGLEDMVAAIDDYADAAERIAGADLALVRRQDGPAAAVHGAVVGTILGDRLIAGLRRLAQEDASARVFNTDGAEKPRR
jgi:DNA-binding transcriptional MerR regulator